VFREKHEWYDVMYIGNCLRSESLCACGFVLLQFNIRPFNIVVLLYRNHKTVNCVTQHRLWSLQLELQFPVVTPKQGTSWCNAHNLCSSHTSNNFGDSHSSHMMASTTHTQRMPEIDLRAHGYQTFHSEN
jgi:hypothetical protein